jgi:hypothetical protein
MSNGLKVGLGILLVGCVIPVVTMVFTLKNIPVYYSTEPELLGQNCFVQYTWQKKPVNNLEHILIFLEKPADYKVHDGVDVMPPEKTDGYFVLPRGVFYNNKNILASQQKVFRMAKKDVRVFIMIKGKAFPVHLSKEDLMEAQALMPSVNEEGVFSGSELGPEILKSQFWPKIKLDLEDKRQKLANGKLDLKPHKRRSDFMR